MAHITVLPIEAVVALNLKQNSVVFDCTLGSGGHATEILKHLGNGGVYVGMDADETAIKAVSLPKTKAVEVKLLHRNFSDIKKVSEELNLIPTAILADLGWRTEQFETGNKGFSFNLDEPLLMTYGNQEDYIFTAYDIINDWEESSIADVIYGYGEETAGRRIAKAIVTARKKQPITTAKELAAIVTEALPAARRHSRLNPATKTFQALRIAVNDELGVLKTLLSDGFASLAPGGRLAIITFHSKEDKIVKEFFKTAAKDGLGTLVTKKPMTPSREEEVSNPRSRSAKLRVIEKN